jgi:hypothetical protein
MDRRKFFYLTGGLAGLVVQSWDGTGFDLHTEEGTAKGKIVGMYVHEGWPYNHPYAARTWNESDWRGYASGLSRIGYNTIIIWPALETMPNPLKSSDRKHMETTTRVVDILRQEFGFRVYITLCPNVVAYQQVANKYPFEHRPLFASTALSDPSDPVALKRMMSWNGRLLRSLERMDGLVIIDSDMGGYPGSTTAQFVDLLGEYRKILDQLRPGIELVYWMHVGWAAFSSYNATGIFRWGTPEEAIDVLTRLKKLDPKPWRIAIHTLNPEPSGADLKLAEKLGLASNALAFNYGAIEDEPSFPMTNFGNDTAYQAGHLDAPGGVVANAQTHSAQLPNTFAFARGATGKTLPAEADYVEFADQLIDGQGQQIVQGWKALSGSNPVQMRTSADTLQTLVNRKLTPGPLKGLLFGAPESFIADLVMELSLKAAYEDFVAATESSQEIKEPFKEFVETADAYQKRTGYQCAWSWAKLDKTLRTLKSQKIDAILDEKKVLDKQDTPSPGGPYHNRYNDGVMLLETLTPRLIAAMKETLHRLEATSQ